MSYVTLSTGASKFSLKAIAGRILSNDAQRAIKRIVKKAGSSKMNWHLERVRRKVWEEKAGALVRCFNYNVRINDGPSFYMQYKDEFIRRIYHFEARRPEPLIIDGGSNIGMSILYFKHVYPSARVIGFEPDPAIFNILRGNLTRNNIKDVTVVNAGLGEKSGTATFLADGSDGGQLGEGENSITVQVERLSDYLSEPVDLLKLNIEGEELPVLQEVEASGKLNNVRELVLEYHGWPGREQRLGAILNLLSRQGFRYLIHDFDAETCAASKPPFHLVPETTWFCLVYAKRIEQ